MFQVCGGLFMGWALGANDASNVIGTAVASRIVSFCKASFLCGACILLGAILQGEKCIGTVSGLSGQTLTTLAITSFAAAFTVFLMINLKLPISASQSIVGAIAGIGLATESINWLTLQKILICWVATPLGAVLTTFVVYWIMSLFMRCVPMSILTRDKILWSGLLIVGAYGSYAIGANNVCVAVGIYSGHLQNVTDQQLAIIGGLSIALGVVTYGKRMMFAVGKGLMTLNAFTALTTVISMAVTVHIFTFVGVPVSARQAIIGSIFGLSLLRGLHTLRLKALRNVLLGWFLTPLTSLILAAAGYAIFA